MPPRDHPLTTPIYFKTRADMPRPKDPVAHIMARTGLYLFRRDSWLGESCVPARTWPCELERHAPYFVPAFPLVPQNLIERLVGFFDIIGMRCGGEAIILLIWDLTRRRYRVIVPQQVATVGLSGNGKPFPIGVEYHPPLGLPADWSIVGDVHSHVDSPAYTSAVDRADEAHSPGLHIIVGRIDQEPPEMSVAAVIDGYRFELPWRDAIAGYQQRRWRVPRTWLEQVRSRVDFVARGSGPAWKPGGPAPSPSYLVGRSPAIREAKNPVTSPPRKSPPGESAHGHRPQNHQPPST